MHHPLNPIPHHRQTARAAGPHVLDVSMFWGVSGGVRRVLSAKREQLRAAGWRHTVIAPAAEGAGLIDCGGLRLPLGGGYRVVAGRGRAERQIEFAAPDLIESADPYTLAWAVLASARRLHVPTVAFCHSDLPALAARLTGSTLAARWALRYLVGLYRRFDLVLAPSRGLAERLQAWGVPRVAVQPLGVDCAVFTPQARDETWRVALCSQQDLAPSTRLLLYTGRFAPEKNLQLLADAVRLLGPGHALVAVGNGPAPPRGSHVRLLSPEPDAARLARMVASCDAYVHAGDQETFGLGVIEAMACGTPVVAAAAGALKELVRDAGLLVERADPRAWAEALRAALGSTNAPLRRAALARAQAHDWPRVTGQLLQRYTALLGRSAAAAATHHASPARLALPQLADPVDAG